MPSSKKRSRADDFEDLLGHAPIETDPEEDRHGDSDDDDDDQDEDTSNEGGREHYAEVGKSKLRKPKEVALGPQYRGSRVSRDAVEADGEDEDDPFSKGFDDESSEEERLANGDRDSETGEESHSDEEGDEDMDEDLEDVTDDTDLSDEEGEDDAISRKHKGPAEDDRAELRKIMAAEQKAVASSISQANRADAEKGRAVKRQRATFDSLLNTRIKLQKTLVAANTIVGTSADDLQENERNAQQAVEAAETAAFNLWSSLNTFRESLISSRRGEEPKPSAFTISSPTSKLWQHVQLQEESSMPHRNATLQRWSVKARGATALPQRSRINNTMTQATIIDVLQEHLNAPDRLLKRAHTPRSCAPLQLSQKIVEDEKIYDDADFYGLLLKELLEQKSADSVASANLVDMDFGRMRREAKTRKNVDTKASKGRKLRYTVHEKLQNFMAPEDRSSWGERQTDDLFGSLFGQRLGLAENAGNEDEEMEDQIDPAEAGLMLFRS